MVPTEASRRAMRQRPAAGVRCLVHRAPTAWPAARVHGSLCQGGGQTGGASPRTHQRPHPYGAT
eukprot:5367757-Lingulodinium_polyedra.AAC.1